MSSDDGDYEFNDYFEPYYEDYESYDEVSDFDPDTCRDLRKDYFFYYDDYCPKDCSPLYKAVFDGDLNRVNSLLDEYSEKEEHYGQTMLHIAAVKGYDQIVDLFCQHNFPVNKEDNYGETALHLAIRKNHPKVFTLLLKESNLNAKNFREETPLHFALEGRHFQLAKILIENNADVSIKNKYGKTPLYHAADNGNMEMVKLLMMSEHFTLENKNSACKVALEKAVKRNYFELVKYLVENGFKMPKMAAFLSETQDRQPNTSEICDNLNASKFLSDGLLHTALNYRHLEIWEYLLKCSLKMDSNKYSKLHFAVQVGHVETVIEILKQQANKVKTDSLASKLAVYIAVENGNETILKILLEAGYSTESCYEDRTPLHIAATFNHTRLVKILLEAGSNIDSKTINNYTSLDFAAVTGQSAVVKFLLEAGADIGPYTYSLENVLRRGFNNLYNWIVTPFMFQNLLKITEMVLIARNNENSFCHYAQYYRILQYIMNIRVSRENEQNNCLSFKLKEETSNKEGAKESRDNTSVGEFRPEILRCFLSYLECNDEVEDALYKVIKFCTDPDPSVFDVILELNYDISLFHKYKSKLFLLDYVEDVGYLTYIPPYMLWECSNECLKLTVARLVLLPDDLDSKGKKMEYYNMCNLLDWRNECEEQLKCMQKTEIIDECNVTLYNILTQTVEKVAKYMRNKDLLETLETSYIKFPAYALFLKMRVERGKRRRNLIDKCVNYILHHIKINYKVHLSILDIDNIFNYISVQDLWSLLKAFA